jgi:hypothetical protein
MSAFGSTTAAHGQSHRSPYSKMSRVLWIPLLLLFFGLVTSSASAGTPEEINHLPTLDSLNRTEPVLSNGGKWGALAWDTSTTGHNPGQDTTSGWGPWDSFSVVNGAYWGPSSFSDETGEAAAITMQTSPGGTERYVALWLDMPSPGSVKTGYQLRWTYVSGTTFSVVLSKYSAGTQTTLASNAAVTIPNGSTLAISDTGGTVAVWQGSGGSLTSILSAGDTSFSSGYAGIEGSGSNSRSVNFKAGPLTPPPDTTISEGPNGNVVRDIMFSFTGSGGPTSFECSLDGAAYTTCSSPAPYSGLAEGPHTFRVRGVNAGGADPTPAEHTFQVFSVANALTRVAILDSFERSEVPLATGKWMKSQWAASIGGSWTGAYHGYGSSSSLSGAYWNRTGFSDGEGTVLASGAIGTGATASGQYLALWLDMPEPSSSRTGYEARFTGNGTNYTVDLSKWVGGTRTVLVSVTGVSLPVGTVLVLTETAGGRVSIWSGTSTFAPILTAIDSSFSNGRAGLDVNGIDGTIYNFRAGPV